MAELGAPTYWGDQPMVGGPAYAGAALIFLFVLSMFVIRTPDPVVAAECCCVHDHAGVG
jgi:hypothetical protein